MKNKIFIIFLYFAFTLKAQNPAFFKIGEREFANNDIYTLLFDEGDDVLYVGTDNGLFAYKQNKFVQLNGPSNQIGNSIFSLKQNKNGDIFCNNLSGQIFKIEDNSLIVFYQIPKDENINYLCDFHVQDSSIIVSTRSKSREISYTGKEIKLIFEPSIIYNSDVRIKTTSKLKDGSIVYSCSDKNTIFRYYDGTLDSMNVEYFNSQAYSNFFNLNNNLFSICNGGNLNSSSTKLIQNYQPKNKEQVFSFSDNELIGLNQKKGLHFLKLANDTLYESQHFFDETFISSFCKKSNDMLFFGSFGNGIYVIPNRYLIVSEYDHLFLGMAIVNDTLYLSTRSGYIFRVANELELISSEDFNIDKLFSIYGNFKFNTIPQKGLIYSAKKDLGYDIKDMVQINNDLLIVASSNGVLVRVSQKNRTPKKLNYSKIKGLDYILYNKNRCQSVEWSQKDSLIYYSTTSGVFAREWKPGNTIKLTLNNKPFAAPDLEFKKDYLICGTGKNGVLFFKDNKLNFQLTTLDGLKSNSIKKIKVHNEMLYILSRAGLQIYNLNEKYFIEPSIKEGVVNEDITNFEINKNLIWLLEKNRFYGVDLESIYKNESIGQLHIDSITVNNHALNYTKDFIFKYNQNKFSFYFDYRNIETKSETTIDYKLEGFNDNWITLTPKENQINYDYLPSGNYTFKIKANYRNQNTNTFVYSFQIKQPYWQTWWFYLLTIIAVTIISWLIFMMRIKSIKRVNKSVLKQKNAEKNALDSQLTAIRAQMNPHFIFNSINSIQDLILKKDTLQSYDYLVQFSKLVRNALDYSEKEFIYLKNEIDFLHTYLNLEKLRFKNDLFYEITTDIQEPIQIPTLITQPFVENAIKHGLLHKEGEKRINIDFSLQEETLICTITDNGIGRTKAKEIKNRQKLSHKSFSTIAIKKRLSILEQKLQQKCYFTTKDLLDENNNAIGTEIKIFLPKL